MDWRNVPEMKETVDTSEFDLRKFRDELKHQSYYSNELRAVLPKYVFKPVPQRLIWFFIHFIIIAACGIAIYNISLLLVDILCSVAIGHSLACLFFVGHEIMHGSVLKNKKSIVFFGTLCFAPWGLYHKGWIAAHNQKHHQHTQHSFKDPDCFGSKKYRYNKILHSLTQLLPGSRSALSYTFLFWFFSFYCFYVVYLHKPGIFTNKKSEVQSKFFLVLVYLFWITFSILVMPFGFIYFFLIPLLVSNFVVMSYIATNHFLSPLTEEVNDPLVNSLSVKTFKIFNVLHMNFSHHVEHHIFPYVSPKYAPLIAKALREKFPAEYNEMSQRRALKLLYQRPKFYYDQVTLIDPKSKEKFPTIILDDIF